MSVIGILRFVCVRRNDDAAEDLVVHLVRRQDERRALLLPLGVPLFALGRVGDHKVVDPPLSKKPVLSTQHGIDKIHHCRVELVQEHVLFATKK